MFCPKCGTENPENGKFCRSCGTDIGIVSQLLSGNIPISYNSPYLVDPRKRAVSWETAITTIAAGAGMLIIAIFLAFSGLIGASHWWFWLLIPAFAALANGITKYFNLKRLERMEASFILENQSNKLPQSSPNMALPPTQTDYVKPNKAVYQTSEFIGQPSVTEETTKHLKIDE